jgi:DNA-binding transcriptional LysR family regulator
MSKKRMYGLRLIWLEAFLAVIDGGSFSRAADILKCDQSNVSLYVQELGLWLGYDLFLRNVPIPLLSSEGQKFEGVARQVVELLKQSRSSQAMDKQSVATQEKR